MMAVQNRILFEIHLNKRINIKIFCLVFCTRNANVSRTHAQRNANGIANNERELKLILKSKEIECSKIWNDRSIISVTFNKI